MMHVIITGSTKGIGLALAKEFLISGDSVLVSSSTSSNVSTTLIKLTETYPNQVIAKQCDVKKFQELEELGKYAIEQWGSIDIWINNAGINSSYKPLTEINSDEIEKIVATNSIGTIYGCKVAIEIMNKQKFGHIFNMEGLGSNGRLSPKLATYGMTKNSIPYFTKTLRKEMTDSNVGIHTLSPGMVLTDLIIPHANSETSKIFNILCETPDTVAKYLVPRIRRTKGSGRSINFLTKKKVIWRFITAKKRKNRFFDLDGNLLY
ncbi:MAG: SDR family oxidoreductase [Candidatus Heimdallarchaeota archaeon]|nr:SDR family oxidoreductase [Candidatus Heimdallarchaeota archaeon]